MMLNPRRLTAAFLLGLLGTVAACGSDDGDGPTTPTLGVPANVQVTALNATSVRVTFDAVAGATGYEVQRAPQGSDAYATVGTPAVSSYDDTGLAAETSYSYRVAATAGSVKSAYSAAVSGTTSTRPIRSIAAHITTSRTFHRDTVYRLESFVQVRAPAVLTVQAGTRVIGDPASALFIMPGARIEANGTADAPIVFTSSRDAGNRRPGDWGGVILIGNGVINRTGAIQLEGTGTNPTTNPVLTYGGSAAPNNADNSGTLRYVRIEFAGFGPQQDAELNSLTMAAVGSGTTIEYVQTLAGLDDSFEWFGGAVNGKYLVSYEAGDDHFDAAEGYVGRNQFLVAFQSARLEPRPGSGQPSSDPQGFEIDGCADAGGTCVDGQNAQPYTIPLFANFTMVGTGTGVPVGSGGIGMVVRRGAGGFYVNGVIARWPTAAISLRDVASTQARATEGNLVIRNVYAAENGVLQEGGSGRFSIDAAANLLESAAAGTTAASLFTALPATPTNAASLDWAPSAAAAFRTGGTGAFTGTLATKAGTFVTGTAYRGAADPAGPKWWAGWTSYARN